MEDLSAAKLDDVKEWFQTYYGAANAVLVVAGDMKSDDREGEGRAVFRRHPGGAADRSAGAVGGEAHRQPAGRDARPGAAGAGLQGVERARAGARPTGSSST